MVEELTISGPRRRATVHCERSLPPGAVLRPDPPQSSPHAEARNRQARQHPGVSDPLRIAVTINGKRVLGAVEPRLLLSDFIRQDAGLTGTHVGCEHGVCGACTILLDGEAVRSCLLFAVQVDGHDVQTVEGLAPGGTLHPLQAAFRDAHALQCGFCTPGILLTLIPFLRDNPDPTEAEIREALSGNLCRCTGYANMIDAVRRAARSEGAS